jgi:hypothetical protein
MPGEPQEEQNRDAEPARRASGSAESEAGGLWEGMPLTLEGTALAEGPASLPPGEETVERPLAELLPAEAVPPSARWLSRWLLLTGLVAAAQAVAAVGAALLSGTRAVAWRGPLVAFDGAVVLLVLRAFLVAGFPLRTVLHRTFGLAGMTACAVLTLGAGLRALGRLVRGEALPGQMAGLLLFGLIGLASGAVFLECLRGRRWACRTAALSFVTLGLLLAAQQWMGYGEPLAGPAGAAALTARHWPASLAAALCAVGFVVAWDGLRRWDGARRLALVLAAVWLAALLGVAWFLGWRLAWEFGWPGACWRLSLTALAWAAAGFAAVLVPGLALAWRRRGPLAADATAATGFAWTVAALTGLIGLALFLPLRPAAGALELSLVVTAAACAVATARLAQADADWMSRWAALPMAGAAVVFLASLGRLQVLARSAWPGGLSALGVTGAWCPLAVALALAAAGVFVRRHRHRAAETERTLGEDMDLLRVAGAGAAWLVLVVLLALKGARPADVVGLRGLLGSAGRLGGDLLTLVGGDVLRGAVAQAWRLAGPVLGGSGPVLLAGLALGLLGVHVLASPRFRWSLTLLTLVWSPVLMLAAAAGLLYASRLFIPLHAPRLVSAPGMLLGSSFACRLALLAVVGALVLRFAEATVSAWRRADGAELRPEGIAGRPAAPGARSPQPGVLTVAGTVAATSGLALAGLLRLTPQLEAALYELARLAGRWATGVEVVALRVGELAAGWPGYAAAAAVIAFLLVCVHEECRRGRIEVLPIVGAVWTAAAMQLAVAWGAEAASVMRPFDPGRLVALAIAAVLVTAVLVSALAVWFRWRRLRREGPYLAQQAQVGAWASHSLGALGLAGCLVLGLVVLHGALRESDGYRSQFAALADAAQRLAQATALAVESLRETLALRGDLRRGAGALAAVCVALLALHFLARYRVRWARWLVYGLWWAVVLGGAVGMGHALTRPSFGTWPPAQVAALAAGSAVWLLILAALVRAPSEGSAAAP